MLHTTFSKSKFCFNGVKQNLLCHTRNLHKWSIEADNKLVEMMSRKGWKEVLLSNGSGKTFLRSGEDARNGSKVTFRFFANKEKLQVEGIVHFGELTEGPPGNVHGGASASAADGAMGVNCWLTGNACVTGNLNVNYRNKIPTNTSVFIQSAITHDYPRKLLTAFKIQSLDEKTVYSEGNAVFVKLGKLDEQTTSIVFP